MFVVRQIDHLADTRHFGHLLEGAACAPVVKGLHDVVGDEGQRFAGSRDFVIAGDSECQIELEPGALGEILGEFRSAAGGIGDQEFLSLVGLRRQAGILSAADPAEGFEARRIIALRWRSRKSRSAVSAAMTPARSRR